MYKIFNRNLLRSSKAGFTLIELLVVIAIIGILAGIVLAALGNVRQRGANSGVAANLAGMRTSAELWNQANGNTYDGFCTSTLTNGGDRPLDAAILASGILNQTALLDSAGASGRATCNDSAGGWAAEVPLAQPVTQFWCADFNGFSGTTTVSTLTGGTDVTCN